MVFPTTSATLIKQLSDKELREQAWEEFFKKYRGAIKDIAIFKGLDEYESEEVLQKVLVKFYKSVNNDFIYNESIAKFRTFLSSIIKSCIYDQLRLRKNYSNELPELYDENSPDELLDMILMEKWRVFAKKQAIEELKLIVEVKTFQIFELYVLQECSPEQVAKMLKCSINNVYAVKHRCITKLQEIIKQMNMEDESLHLDV